MCPIHANHAAMMQVVMLLPPALRCSGKYVSILSRHGGPARQTTNVPRSFSVPRSEHDSAPVPETATHSSPGVNTGHASSHEHSGIAAAEHQVTHRGATSDAAISTAV
ncbi:hypothetical protein HaLaN_00258 [Haematococcus lacustris]|uniref:Secreted protein n=1 Tax=Haematococcus lacustris TaxID=44745 RepID=A0A699YD22_HAELA|nr:hypothetical protein HaLaN_00258 [Haematococcus lacustris]